MAKFFVLLFFAAIPIFYWMHAGHSQGSESPVEKDDKHRSNATGEERVSQARRNCEALLRARCLKAGLPYPPAEIFLRAFKREALLELWAREKPADAFQLLVTYPVLAASGVPGPKRKEGDLQVPEGFYRIDHFNPESRFHLSLRINYPNAADRLVADPQRPGSDIYIHGGAQSIGCLPIGDPGIEELFLIALDTFNKRKSVISIDIYPARMEGAQWMEYAREPIERDPALKKFWKTLQRGYDTFEAAHRVLEKRPGAKD